MATANGKNGIGSRKLETVITEELGKQQTEEPAQVSKPNEKRKNNTTNTASSKKTRQTHLETTTSTKPKQWIINAFAMQSPGHLNPGLFKHPSSKSHKYTNIKHWISLAQKLEAAKFHAIFFADVLGGYDVYKGPANLTPTIPAASQFPINDPLYAVGASTYFSLNLLVGCEGYG